LTEEVNSRNGELIEAALAPEPVLDTVLPEWRIEDFAARNVIKEEAKRNAMASTLNCLKKKEQLEHGFAKGGCLLIAGEDPTGNRGTLPGFYDKASLSRSYRLGSTPVEAIQIYTTTAHVGWANPTV
jgi:hypothetical protein